MRIKRRVFLDRILAIVQNFFLLFGVCGILLTPIPVYAQVAGFTECSFESSRSNQGDGTNSQSSIQSCLQQIFQFTFVLSIFIIAIRVAIIALDNYNPFSNGKASGQAINLVWEVTLGLLLIGGPAIIINTVNPAALNLSFIGISSLVTPVGNTPQSGGGNNNSNSQDGGTTINNGGTGSATGNANTTSNNLTPDSIDQAIDVIQPNDIANSKSQSVAFTSDNFQFSRLFSITTNAQATTQQIQDAEKTLSTLFKLENECTLPFVTPTTYRDCIIIEGDEFIAARNRVLPETRQTLMPLVDINKVFSGRHLARQKLLISDTIINPTQYGIGTCSQYYAILKESEGQRQWLVQSTICGDQSTPIWASGSGGTQVVSNGSIDAGGLIIPDSGSLSIISN